MCVINGIDTGVELSLKGLYILTTFPSFTRCLIKVYNAEFLDQDEATSYFCKTLDSVQVFNY